MRELLSYISRNYRAKSVTLGHRPDNTAAARLYSSLGFRVTAKTDTEVTMKLSI
jgi:ribosomal protein S18 acetylase RimI-like enzyme